MKWRSSLGVAALAAAAFRARRKSPAGRRSRLRPCRRPCVSGRAMRVERDLLVLDADEAQRQRPRQPAQARDRRRAARSAARPPLRELAGDLLGRRETAGRCAEELAAAGVLDRAEQFRLLPSAARSARRSPGWRVPRSGRRPRPEIDRMCRERPSRSRLRAGARQVRRNQLVDVGVDGKMTAPHRSPRTDRASRAPR